MARINTPTTTPHRTHEGGPAKIITAEQQLRRSVMSCLLWERTFYEDGVDIAQRIEQLASEVNAEKVSGMAIEAREEMKLRHAPLLLVRALARRKGLGDLVSKTLETVIQRADELAEFLSIYWKDRKQPLSAQVKLGLARAFTKFDAYQLAKYNRTDDVIKLRDVLFLCHAKPKDKEQESMWKKLIDGNLEAPDTWEVALSAGADKGRTFERLIAEKKLGAMALLRNLRNMIQAGVDRPIIASALEEIKVERVLPYRFISAARYAVEFEPELERAMLKSLETQDRLDGRTLILVDVSDSMNRPLSERSELSRMDAACALAVMVRELCDEVVVYSFSRHEIKVPARHGFALRDAVVQSQEHDGTYLGRSLAAIINKENFDRIIVITDEQAHDSVATPKGKAYLINVGSYKNGIGYGRWVHIDGFSESTIKYIQAYESLSKED